jgi:hypothetical protein
MKIDFPVLDMRPYWDFADQCPDCEGVLDPWENVGARPMSIVYDFSAKRIRWCKKCSRGHTDRQAVPNANDFTLALKRAETRGFATILEMNVHDYWVKQRERWWRHFAWGLRDGFMFYLLRDYPEAQKRLQNLLDQ